MRRFVPLALAILLNTCGPTLAPAHPSHFAWEHHCPPDDMKWMNDQEKDQPKNFTIYYGGVFPFCKTEPKSVLCHGHPGGALPLVKILSIDAKLRAQFQYRDDAQLYPETDGEWWAGYTMCGDCEDYALTMSELLADAGEGGSYMRLSLQTVWPSGDGHATLLVDTKERGTVEISVGDELPYTYKFDPRRDATIRMDGHLILDVQSGFVAHPNTQIVDRIKK